MKCKFCSFLGILFKKNYVFPDVFVGETVTEMGHGFDQIRTDYDSDHHRTTGRKTDGEVISNADCRTAYASAPVLHPYYTDEFIKDEMICIEAEDDSQICQVGL